VPKHVKIATDSNFGKWREKGTDLEEGGRRKEEGGRSGRWTRLFFSSPPLKGPWTDTLLSLRTVCKTCKRFMSIEGSKKLKVEISNSGGW
jgi:hypothetical protein